MAVNKVTWLRRHFPFNAAQTVNIVGEIGPLFAMFIVNGIYGITAGAAALIVCTIASLIACLVVLGRPPVMPFIAGTVSIVFATLTFVTGDVAGAAKALRDSSKTLPMMVVKGGVLGGVPLSADDVNALADLPSREELLARIAGAFQAPLVKTASLFSALPRKFAYGLQALIEKQAA